MSEAFTVGRKKKPELKWESVIERNLISYGRSSRDRIFASSSGLCARQTAGLILMDDDVEEKRLASAQFYFKIGSVYEKIMERAFRKSGLFLDAETRVELDIGPIPTSGRIDFVLRDPNDNDEVVLVELKSCGKLPDKPRPYQLAQLHTYMVMTGMEKGVIWYVSRSIAGWNGKLLQRAFEIEMTTAQRETIAMNIAVGAHFAKSKVLPNIPPDMKKYKCGFCPLVPLCWDKHHIGMDVGSASKKERLDLRRLAENDVSEVMAEQGWLREEFIRVVLP